MSTSMCIFSIPPTMILKKVKNAHFKKAHLKWSKFILYEHNFKSKFVFQVLNLWTLKILKSFSINREKVKFPFIFCLLILAFLSEVTSVIRVLHVLLDILFCVYSHTHKLENKTGSSHTYFVIGFFFFFLKSVLEF